MYPKAGDTGIFRALYRLAPAVALRLPGRRSHNHCHVREHGLIDMNRETWMVEDFDRRLQEVCEFTAQRVHYVTVPSIFKTLPP
jgi:hypothetical protein